VGSYFQALHLSIFEPENRHRKWIFTRLLANMAVPLLGVYLGENQLWEIPTDMTDHSRAHTLVQKYFLQTVALCGSILISGFYLVYWFGLMNRGIFSPIDFWGFYTGAFMLRHGIANQLYDFAVQAQY
jgi:hypothetical protein